MNYFNQKYITMKNKITMMVLLNLLITLLFISQVAYTQTGWEEVYSNSDEFIRDICFVPGDDGLWQTGWGITGYPESLIIKTTDGGDTWIEITQTFSTLLASISFADENTGYICTLKSGAENPEGLIMKSTDGGLTWTQVYGSEDATFDKIKFEDSQNGVVTGYPSLYTSDGGITWTESTTPELYWQIDYAGNDTYFGVELGGDVGKTIDGGAIWTSIYSFSPTMMGGIAFFDEMNGLVGGDVSTVAVTHDGGDTWETTTLGTGERFGKAVGAFDANIMYAGLDIEEIWMTTDGGDSWELDTLMVDKTFREMAVTPFNVVYLGGFDMTTGGGVVWRKVNELPLVADFEISEQATCTGSSIDFTDLSYYDVVSWDWTFEGGTPASSTDQNPTVTYNSGGVFDVTLTVTNSNGDTQTLVETDLITVLETPAQAETPSGDENICTSNVYAYSIPEIEFAETYDWELSPSEAGDLSWNENEATLATSPDWSGDFTLRARAGNFCANGEWSNPLNGTISLSPESFVLAGGGSFCEGGEGVEITLAGSQSGVDYQLYLDGQTIGEVISGTGESLSFGFQTLAGIYEAVGFDANCETSMSGQIEVIMFALPTPEIGGSAMVCDEEVANYETANNAGSTFTWEVVGGTIIEGQGTHLVTIEWGIAGNGAVIVTEQDENGCSALTDLGVLIDDCTGIVDNKLQNSFKAYPNPAQSNLNLEFSAKKGEKIEILIYNSMGQLVMAKRTNANGESQTINFNIENLPNGLYVIAMKNSEQIIIKEKFEKN